MLVQDFMTKTVHVCDESKTLSDAVKIMLDKGISILPIVDDKGGFVGVITESDFVGKEKSIPHSFRNLRSLFGETFHVKDITEVYRSVKDKKIADVMSRNPLAIEPDASLTKVVELMNHKGLKRIPVVENERVVGVITRKDLIRAFSLVNK